MEVWELKKISISNLILVILNDKNDDTLRKCAEIELKRRIRNVGWDYDDLLHFDDKVIKKRGLDVDNYLISPNVNMQQLMETYFMFDKDTELYYLFDKDTESYYLSDKYTDTNYLLFSEKHLCNEIGFAEPFFRKICSREKIKWQ